MDKDHRLTTPDNESLQTIEQVGDHSELASLYPEPHDEWEGVEILSSVDRESKRDREQTSIVLSIRKWFAVIGLLIPMPFVAASILIAISLTYFQVENVALQFIPSAIGVIVWLIISYKSMKKVYAIFYDHSIRAAPFIVTLLLLLVASLQALYVSIVGFYTDSAIYNAAISSLTVLTTSVALSAILILIWTAQRIGVAYKIGCIGIVAGVILLATLLVNVF